MSTNTKIVRHAVAAMFLGLLLTAPGPASAVPERGPSGSGGSATSHAADCLLERIDTQLVRCDALTGAGVPAPAWIPARDTK